MKCQVKVEINTTGTELGGSEAVRLNKLKTTKEPLQTKSKPAARYTSSCPGNTRKKHKITLLLWRDTQVVTTII